MREHAWRRVPEAHLSFASAPESWQHKMFQGLPLPFAISHVVVAGGFTTFAGAKHGPFCCCCFCFFFLRSLSACPPWVGELTHLGRQGRRRRVAPATFTNGNNFNFSDALSRPRTYVAAKVAPRPMHIRPQLQPHYATLNPSSFPLVRRAQAKHSRLPRALQNFAAQSCRFALGCNKKRAQNEEGAAEEEEQRRRKRWSREKNSAKLLQNSG